MRVVGNDTPKFIVKRESIPATVRELTDAQALELQVIENVQRVDVHPLDETQKRNKTKPAKKLSTATAQQPKDSS